MNSPRPKHRVRGEVYDGLVVDGWDVTTKGWPHFFCKHRDGRVALIVLKTHRDRRLKSHQHEVLRTLANYGVRCYLYSPNDQFQRIKLVAPGRAPKAKL